MKVLLTQRQQYMCDTIDLCPYGAGNTSYSMYTQTLVTADGALQHRLHSGVHSCQQQHFPEV